MFEKGYILTAYMYMWNIVVWMSTASNQVLPHSNISGAFRKTLSYDYFFV
jgi:hypothetical protein